MVYRKFLKKYNLPILFSLTMLPIVSIIGIPLYVYQNGIVWQEPVMLIIGWFISGTGITVGYHRLFSHRAFKTYPIIEWLYMLSGSMALQNSIIHWCSDHRRHHKKLDSKDDPYSIKKGFIHAHIGWVVKKNEYKISGVSDLAKKSAVKFQSQYYWTIALFLSFILPLLLGFIYNRPFGALLWGGILRVTLVHHFTFFINSFCHFIGKRNYDLNTTAKDSWIMAFLTFGEGYHNFHHKFQWDYRNGIKWYNFDPSKWIIEFLSLLNITYDLRKAPEYSILKARFNTINRKIKLLSIYNKKKYRNKVKKIMDKSIKDIDMWQVLDNKIQSLKRRRINKHDISIYKQKRHILKLKLHKSLSSLALLFINIKNLS